MSTIEKEFTTSNGQVTLEPIRFARSEHAALAIAAGGVLGLAIGFMRHSGTLRALGFFVLVGGGALYAREKYTLRDEKIQAAKKSVHAALDDLDPVAKAQVLADLAGRTHRHGLGPIVDGPGVDRPVG
jgi:hypothetical protein